MSEELEILNSLNNENIVYVHKEDWSEIQKKLKALEIIKEKKVDVSTLRIEKCDLHKYNECVISSLGEKPLTKEEYDIIVEEVLL